MIITCQKCSSRLQVDETKFPARPFIIRCPKCNNTVDAGAPDAATEPSAPAVAPPSEVAPVAPAVAAAPAVSPAVAPVAPVASSPAMSTPRVEQPTPAPLFEGGQEISEAKHEVSAAERLADLLSGLLNQPTSAGRGVPMARRSWDPRKALVCVPENIRESVARGLTEIGYQVFVAQDTRQAVDRMREAELDVVLLDSRFDPSEQGAIFVTREVNILRPPQRRRLFFVVISPSLRTMDAHAAFLSNVNGIVNVNELEELPKLLDRRIREYNNIYKDFNIALGVSAL